MNWLLNKDRAYLSFILMVVAIMSFWKIGQHDLCEWDESRNGVNAYEMINTGDLIKYYYNGQIDTWNAKPPLMIWLIAISYKFFGFNEFALRLPAVISTLLFFFFCFRVISFFKGSFIGFLCCLILISTKAIIVNHIGLTGDFDALLIMLLTGSVYYFVLYLEGQRRNAIYFVGILTGLAFYTKGTASLVLVPGLFIYAILLKRGNELVKDFRVWIAIVIFLILSGSWFLLVSMYGKHSSESFYGSSNSIETMLIHDTFRRLGSSDFSETSEFDPLFFFTVIDARLNLWNYFFYVSLIIGFYKFYKERSNFLSLLRKDSNRLLLLCFCLIIPLSFVLTIALSKHNWYLAPVFMFIAYVILEGVLFMCRHWKPFIIVFSLLFLFTFTRHILYINNQTSSLHYKFKYNKKLSDKKVVVVSKLKQNVLLYLNWLNTNLLELKDVNELSKYRNEYIIYDKSKVDEIVIDSTEPIDYFENYCVAKIK